MAIKQITNFIYDDEDTEYRVQPYDNEDGEFILMIIDGNREILFSEEEAEAVAEMLTLAVAERKKNNN